MPMAAEASDCMQIFAVIPKSLSIDKNPGLKKYIPVFGWQKSIETPKSESFLGNYIEQSNICTQQMHWN